MLRHEDAVAPCRRRVHLPGVVTLHLGADLILDLTRAPAMLTLAAAAADARLAQVGNGADSEHSVPGVISKRTLTRPGR